MMSLVDTDGLDMRSCSPDPEHSRPVGLEVRAVARHARLPCIHDHSFCWNMNIVRLHVQNLVPLTHFLLS